MSLAKQCDEIVRLIDKTLCDLALGVDGASPSEAGPVEQEFPEDELGRVQDHERLCIVGRPVHFPNRSGRAIIPNDRRAT
jgi:hypothetical protein